MMESVTVTSDRLARLLVCPTNAFCDGVPGGNEAQGDAVRRV
jgi:hypothetical protein